MPVTTKDILTDEDALLAQVEEVIEQRNVFRSVFREADLSNVGSDTAYFVVRDDNPADIEIVPEGGEFPRDMSDRHKVPVERNKYGEEYAITMEAERDGVYNDVQDEANSKMRRMAKRMDAAAAQTLTANLNSDADAPLGDGDGTLTYNDVVDASMFLMDDPYQFEADTIIVGPQGLGDLLKEEVLTHASGDGDQRIRNGRVGPIAGLGDVYVSNTGVLGPGEAIVVDSDQYGREGVWEPTQTDSYEEEKRQISTVMQMWNLMGWCSTRPEAAVKVEG